MKRIDPVGVSRPEHEFVAFSERLADEYSDALADVLCWFRGFAAASQHAEMPPGLNRLRDLNIELKTGGVYDVDPKPIF